MLILVTGGSGSGKSEFAENLAVRLGGNRAYIAAMRPSGEDGAARIERHRCARKNKNFRTVERYTDIKSLDEDGTLLLECMSNLLANEMFSEEGAGENAVNEILEGIRALSLRADNLVIVTNEVFSDGIDYGAETDKYMKNLGTLNCRTASIADEVYEAVCGFGVRIK